ncbi:hypothetical protein BZZ01_00750 [Nostocales cyanobacterium HT-58-2]|nr:hypothetical protein BZZ01_00750 [Nostocales cyanobacterium HT-58-2]
MRLEKRISVGVRKLLFLCSAFLCLINWISSPLALTLGMILSLTVQNPFPRTSRYVAKYLLQGCVILLGFGMNLAVVLKAGESGALFAAVSIVATFFCGNILGQQLKIPVKASVLISAGTAICGGSAIAAVSSVISAAESEISVAMGTVFLLNAVALYVFPPLGHLLHLTPTQFGTWAGVAIHDISSVVGAASHFGLGALSTATAVKLSRALWIVPVSVTAAFIFRRYHIWDKQQIPNPIQIPWFIGLFLLASVVRTFVPGTAIWSPLLTRLSESGLTLTLFLIGAGLSQPALKAVGWKPMVQGMVLWVFISVSSMLIIRQVVH